MLKTPSASLPVKAILGPTNTGKTHLAIERMCGHASGMMGFPLRLLAREVYDRVVAYKGADQVGLITGEEKILPPHARYFLCTAESMPLEHEVAFLALDEAQMGVDDERGHVFTDRLLRARGREETMILGASSLRPLVASLLPQAEIIARPRFSTLSYAAPRKLSRLGKRSAIVCFSTEEVYAIAEMLRRQRGGAAVVMGALSPRTRNAQVAMYQSGEVDYLVATDAIGMGLNMDISHIAFASLGKFDGKRRRRLTLGEMGQIAGRAGRHQRDGSFSIVQLNDRAQGFTPEEIHALEAHEYPPLTQLRWRNPALDFSSLKALVRSLEERPPRPELLRTDATIDVMVLKRLAEEEQILARARTPSQLRLLWNVCQLPDYRKIGPEQHARLILRLFGHLSHGGCVPVDWYAAEVARLDNVQGDIDSLASRIAGIRTWTYVAHQPDWLANPAEWAARTRALEDKLSDALHDRLRQRFVDRRTSVLMRKIGADDHAHITVDTGGEVAVAGAPIGTLQGFTFTVDPTVRSDEKKRALAAAERMLGRELGARATALAADSPQAFSLAFDGGRAPEICWQGDPVACLREGRSLIEPQLQLLTGAALLPAHLRTSILEKLDSWLATKLSAQLRPLQAVQRLARLPQSQGGLTGAGRGIAVQWIESGGCLPRGPLEGLLADIGREDRQALGQVGLRLGQMHLFSPALLKPEAIRWRLALAQLQSDLQYQMLAPLWSGRTSLDVDHALSIAVYQAAGYWVVGPRAVRVDIAERVIDLLRHQSSGRAPFVPSPQAMSMAGLGPVEFAGLMIAIGYRPRAVENADANGAITKIMGYQWRGRTRPSQPKKDHGMATEVKNSPFAALADLKVRH